MAAEAKAASGLAGLADAALEEQFVHRVYDAIAPHFSFTRFSQWPRVRAFLEALPRGALVCDVGCGNGKYLDAVRGCVFTGCDSSSNLAAICRAKGHEVAVADALALPFRDNLFDAVLSIAVVHHLASEPRRLQALSELARVLRRGGRALVYVWSFEEGGQKKGERIVKQEQQDALVEWNMPRRYQGPAPQPAAAAVRPGGLEVQYSRFYHMFSRGELEALVARVPGVRVVRSGLDTQNWFAEIEKT